MSYRRHPSRGRLCHVYCPLEDVYCPLNDITMPQHDTTALQDLLRQRWEAHCKALWQEVERLTQDTLALGVQRVILFGSLVWGNPSLTSDVDLMLIWDTPLGFLERMAEVYRRLQPQVAADNRAGHYSIYLCPR